jgi:hypothetical protein
MNLPTDKLTAHLNRAQHTLSELPEHVDREPLIQMALQALMRSDENVVERFIELAEEQPEVAKRILLSSVSSLVNLHVVHSLTAQLKRRRIGLQGAQPSWQT